MRTNKLLNGIIAFVLAGALAAGVCCMGFASRGNDGKWFGNFKNISTWHWYKSYECENCSYGIR